MSESPNRAAILRKLARERRLAGGPSHHEYWKQYWKDNPRELVKQVSAFADMQLDLMRWAIDSADRLLRSSHIQEGLAQLSFQQDLKKIMIPSNREAGRDDEIRGLRERIARLEEKQELNEALPNPSRRKETN
ncbi:MAG: hypothetical protein OXM87_11945 [Truepera sp.]|nr:hypothetical protein [Truepera sp.]